MPASSSKGKNGTTKRATAQLKKLQAADTCHLLQAVMKAYLNEADNLDLRISLAGAMHHSGWLRNQIEPQLADWDTDAATWVRRGLERQLKTFHGDPLAISALLFSAPKVFFAVATQLFPGLVYAHTWKDGGERYRVVLCTEWNNAGGDGNWAHRCLEVAWKKDASEFFEMHYAKVISGDEKAAHLHGPCVYSSWSTAHLPHGHWIARDSVQDLGPLAAVGKAIAKLPAWVKP